MLRGPSALFGQPALNEQDVQLVKYYINGFPKESLAFKDYDPQNGFPGVAPLPPNILFETRDRRGLAAGCIFAIVFLSVAMISRICLRFWIKQLRWGWDDVAFIIAAPIGITSMACTYWYVTDGAFGQHTQGSTYVQVANLNHVAVINDCCFYTALVLVRSSIVLWVKRVVGLSSKSWSIFCWFFLFVLFVNLVMGFVLWPVGYGGFAAYKAFGDPLWSAKTGTKWEVRGFIMPIVVLNVWGSIEDLVLLFVPAVLFARTAMPFAKRVRLSLLCCFGIATTVVSIKRAIVSIEMNAVNNIDDMWSGFDIAIWTMVEIVLSFLIGSMPMINSTGVMLWERYRQGGKLKNGKSIHKDQGSSSTERQSSDNSNHCGEERV